MAINNKIQVSFRIHKQLVNDVDEQRLLTESPLNQLQYIIALISRSHVLQRQSHPLSKHNPYQLTEKQRNDFEHYLPITTDQSIRFQYRTDVLWLSDLKTNAINKMLYQGLLFEKGQLQ